MLWSENFLEFYPRPQPSMKPFSKIAINIG